MLAKTFIGITFPFRHTGGHAACGVCVCVRCWRRLVFPSHDKVQAALQVMYDSPLVPAGLFENK